MPRDSKVQNLIDKVRETYNLKPFDGSEPLEITIKYHSTVLKPQWRLTDIGINEGSILHVEVEPVTTPLLEIKTSIKMNKFRCIKLLTNEDFKTEKGLNSTVAEVKTQINHQTGLHPSSFRIVTCKETDFLSKSSRPGFTELLDCHTLDYYKLMFGTTIRLRLLNGWYELVVGSIEGSCEKVAKHLEQIANSYERRHQASVSLAMAAQYGHVGLATALMQRENVKPDQIIGEHPLRRWQDPKLWHIVCKRAPVHFSVIHDRLKILKLFCQKNLICHVVRDGTGRSIWRLALLFKARKTMPFLVVKQWTKYISENVVSNKNEMLKIKTLNFEEAPEHQEFRGPRVVEKTDETIPSSKQSMFSSPSSTSPSSTKNKIPRTPIITLKAFCRLLQWVEKARTSIEPS